MAKKRIFTDKEIEEIIDLYKNKKLPIFKIAKIIKTKEVKISKILKENNIELRCNLRKIRENQLIPCACGCGNLRYKYNRQGVERRYIKGHGCIGKSKYDKSLTKECQCGCHQLIPKYDKRGRERFYVKGHREISLELLKNSIKNLGEWVIKGKHCGKENSFYNKHHTEKTKILLGQLKKGSISHNKGKTKDTYEPLRRAGKKLSKYRKGKTHEELYGIEKAKELKLLQSEIMKGEKNPFYGKHHSEEIKKLMSAIKLGIPLEQWKGFASYEPYGAEFNKEFKKFIRERDGCCMLCNIGFEDLHLLKRKTAIHHINYLKKCNLLQNLICLCNSCHSKTNTNHNHWIKFFQSLLTERYGYKYSENGDIILEMKDVERK
jgi:hypothetical protein